MKSLRMICVILNQRDGPSEGPDCTGLTQLLLRGYDFPHSSSPLCSALSQLASPGKLFRVLLLSPYAKRSCFDRFYSVIRELSCIQTASKGFLKPQLRPQMQTLRLVVKHLAGTRAQVQSSAARQKPASTPGVYFLSSACVSDKLL